MNSLCIENSDISIVQFPIVAVGASAGGLEAFKTFVGNIPKDSELAYVFIQHLDPDHQSILAEILSRHTSLPVKTITNRMQPEKGQIFIAPAGHSLTIAKNGFNLSEIKPGDSSLGIIDTLFRSVSEACKEKAIAVILSGTLTDGCNGIRAVKENGGMVIIQNPASAAYSEMPMNAEATGLADLILDLEKIPATINSFASHSYVSGNLALKNLDELEQILAMVKASSGYDFRYYKKNTLIRRILRRMGLKDLASMKDYVQVLKENPNEIRLLFNDLLIGVTEFFRDEDVWKKLKDEIFRKLIKALPTNAAVRVWVPGCSTGEEAYSIAIVLAELFAEYNRPYNAQIFATDIDETAIATARTGIYPMTISEKVSPQRLNLFFTNEDGKYRISRPIRESVIFAVQNLICDAPFSDLDFISCRNLLIYFDPDIQKNIIDLFSFSLRENGYLLLGSSESVGFKHDAFEANAKKQKIFKMIGNKRSDRHKESVLYGGSFANRSGRRVKILSQQQNLESLMHQQLLNKFVPAAVLVNSRGQIVYFHGQTEKYLSMPRNEPDFDLLTLAREGLKTRLRSAIHKMARDKTETSARGIQIIRDGIQASVSFEIHQLIDTNQSENLLLITFYDEEKCLACENVTKLTESDEPMIRQLERELNETREDLHNTIEELETSNEELKASNEEMISMNEELQSTNEELETSKEELQSLNEELNSVNSQLRDKVNELEEANNDLINFMQSSDVATIFLDRRMVIRKFTQAARTLLNLHPSDLGTPINCFNAKFFSHDLEKQIGQVLKSLAGSATELESGDGRFFIRRIAPFRTEDDRIDGVVITFIDITDIKKSQLALLASEQRHREASQLLSVVLDHTHMMTAYLDTDFNYILVNSAFARNSSQSQEYFPGKNHFKLFPNAENKAIFARVVETGEPFFIQGKPFVFADQLERGLTYWDWSLIPVKDEQKRVTSLVFTMVEATSRIKAEIAFKEETKKKNKILESIKDGFFSLNNRFQVTYFNQTAEKLFKIRADQVLGKSLCEAFPDKQVVVYEKQLRQAMTEMQPVHFEVCSGEEPEQEWFEIRAYPFNEGISVYFSALTEQKMAQRIIKEQAESLKQAQKFAQIGSWEFDTKKNKFLFSEEMYNIWGVPLDREVDNIEPILKELVHPEDFEKIMEILDQIEKHQKFLPCEFRIIRPDGEMRTLWAESGETLTNEHGEVIKLSGIIHDITERKKTEAERLQLEKAANRSQKIEALGALAGGIAHNFNNFLCGIFGNIEMALYEADPLRRCEFLKTALSCMEPAKAMTRQLITFSKGGDPEMIAGDIMPCIVSAARFALAGANIELSVEPANNLHKCSFDQGQIAQVINNLVLNSRQAMPDGGKIRISADIVSIDSSNLLNLKPGEYVKIIFADNGPGISEKFAANIFDPFFSTKQGNQGLGLAISHSILLRHGGNIVVDTEVDEGCVFNIFLPVAQKASVEEKKVFNPLLLYAAGHILIMDDELMIREVLTQMLCTIGFEVTAVQTGRQAVEELINTRTHYRAVILDLTVPGSMGGKEACEIIRNSGLSLPVFAASGYASDPVIVEPEKFGFDGSIAKPFSMAELKKVLSPFFRTEVF
ncbi:MAG: chemotaxis protein CheB [Candidatus Rifleibacteriota bacterium]